MQKLKHINYDKKLFFDETSLDKAIFCVNKKAITKGGRERIRTDLCLSICCIVLQIFFS
jgi:hypothetical protein